MPKDELSMLLNIKFVGAILAVRKEDLESAYSIVMATRNNGQNTADSRNRAKNGGKNG